MKYREIFKLWNFWIVVAFYNLYQFIPQFQSNSSFSPNLYTSIGTILGSFVTVLLFYSIWWLIFGRKKKPYI